MLIEDFKDGEVSGWRYFSDQVMGGVSEGNAVFVNENSETFARLQGDVSTANNGGFIQIRRDFRAGEIGDAAGLSLRVKGNDTAYYLHLRTAASRRPWQYFAATFEVTSDWQDIQLPWTDFEANGRGLSGPLDPNDILSIGIVANGRDHRAQLDLAKISAF